MFAIVLALLLILSISAALAAKSERRDYQRRDYQYILLPDGTAEIAGYAGKATVLSIPAQLDGYAVTSIGERAFYSCEGLTEITLPEGLKSIGDNAFSSCKNLTAITLPEGLKSIGDYAFDSCEGLTEITLPAGLTSIGKSAFSSCKNLTAITLPAGLTSIGDRAFKRCAGLTEITLPEGLKSIGDEAFVSCSCLTEITLPEGLTSIGERAFFYCKGLTEITLPEGLTSIGYGAFDHCSSLTEITIPDSVAMMGVNPFLACEKLTQIKVSPDNAVFASIDGVLLHKQEKKLICYPGRKPGKTYAVPQGITAIGDNAFHFCFRLTEITLPEGLTSIGERAFYYCEGLTEITIPDSVAMMGVNPFARCCKLTQINASPDNAVFASIDGVLFYKQEKKLICYPGGKPGETYAVPQGITAIGDWAFSCYGLTEITLPGTLAEIGEYAFDGCPEDALFTVVRDSYGAKWCEENGKKYTYPDANDWLLNWLFQKN